MITYQNQNLNEQLLSNLIKYSKKDNRSIKLKDTRLWQFQNVSNIKH